MLEENIYVSVAIYYIYKAKSLLNIKRYKSRYKSTLNQTQINLKEKTIILEKSRARQWGPSMPLRTCKHMHENKNRSVRVETVHTDQYLTSRCIK